MVDFLEEDAVHEGADTRPPRCDVDRDRYIVSRSRRAYPRRDNEIRCDVNTSDGKRPNRAAGHECTDPENRTSCTKSRWQPSLLDVDAKVNFLGGADGPA